MASNQFTCRWTLLSLSNIAGVFVPDIILPRDSSEAIKHGIVTLSITGSDKRAQKWLEDNKVPNAKSVKVFHSWKRCSNLATSTLSTFQPPIRSTTNTSARLSTTSGTFLARNLQR
jgi:hypothetical protein